MKNVCIIALAVSASTLGACDRAAPTVPTSSGANSANATQPHSVAFLDDLASSARHVQTVAGFDLELAQSGDDITLDWQDFGGPYEVWRSTDPYFAPGHAGATMLAGGLTMTSHVDVGGNDDTSYYYRIEAATGLSTIAGKYVQGCAPGYNKISQPLITSEQTASEFFDSFDSAPSSVHLFDATTQRYATWTKNYDPSWGMFSYGLGQCPIVRPSWDTGPFAHKTVGHVPAFGHMQITLQPGHNYVTLPLSFGDMMASELLELLPEHSTVASFTPAGPGAPYRGGAGDFEIDAGSCIAVSVTDAADWPPPYDPLHDLDDEFDDPNLPGWTQHNGEGATVTVQGRQCIVEPDPNTVWYNNQQGYHLCKPVSGSFAVTADLTVTNAAGGPAAPGDLFRIGGLMIRDPESPAPNTYHVGLGVLDDPNTLIFEHKSTDDGTSTVGSTPYGQSKAELRICRVDGEVHGLYRAPGGEWTLAHTEARPDLPDTVLAGPIAYALQSDPDLRCTVDSVTFKTAIELDDCTTD
ncbi:MAG: hypothetical protein AAGF11_05610 [Myxococcota bacterium]